MAARLKLSKKDRALFVSWSENNPPLADFLDERCLLKLLYRHGKEFCANKLILEAASAQREIDNLPRLLDFIEKSEIPSFPLRGRDLIEQGIAENAKIGETLKQLENEWIESGFQMSRDELLQKAI